jgi:DNA-directed RNA polymerase specialized sigma24 family protein
VTDEEIRWLRGLHKRGVRPKLLAWLYGITTQKVATVTRDRSEDRQVYITAEDQTRNRQIDRAWVAAELTLQEIATEIGCNSETVGLRVKQAFGEDAITKRLAANAKRPAASKAFPFMPTRDMRKQASKYTRPSWVDTEAAGI